MNTLNNVRKIGTHIVLGLAVLGMGGASFAVYAHDAKPGEVAGKHERHAKWGEQRAKRQTELHNQLKLSAAQEPTWAAYQSATKPADRGAQRAARPDWFKLSAPARMAQRLARSKQHIAVMEARLAALNSFYATLTPEQKKLFDINSMQRGQRGGQHGRHHGMHG